MRCPYVVLRIACGVDGPCMCENAGNEEKIKLVEMLRPFRSSTPGTLARLLSRFRSSATPRYLPKNWQSRQKSAA